jgi:outer membrane biogenesis lipoprotein LolB
MVSIQSTQWQQSIRIALVIGLMAFLQSCVSVPAIKPAQSAASKALYLKHQQEIAAIQQFSLQGRIGVQSDNKGFSGGLTWQHEGYLITLKQDGWDIKYENYSEQNGRLLPRKILLKNEKIHLKLLIEHWGNMN